ncbi:hypothetical protein [Listeria booriae]|uniref:hypothetical protein n=1 Tax=Listeria booriae TaxID=1552123 RepID=UPI0016238D19|nr:hypothetical protein [Listeria booriae]MBC1228585.1 hypothetical protein [Listeria booriae]MBC1248086.1 hypothetical protein [Listeria booriae]MBC2069329.1 hypothetical protein [Listeria booriae]
MKRYLLGFICTIGLCLVLSGCGQFSIEGRWNGQDQDGNGALLDFKEDTVLVDIGLKTSYSYKINSKNTVIQFKSNNRERNYNMKIKDDDHITLYNKEDDETLTLER